jgi:hypothetical protein
MADLLTTTIDGSITEKIGSAVRADGGTSDIITIAGSAPFPASGTSPICLVTTAYHRAKNRVVAYFFDGATLDTYAVAAAPSTLDGESLGPWGIYGGASSIGKLMDNNIYGNACSYDRHREEILWAGSGYSPNQIYTRVTWLNSALNPNDTGVTYGAAATWAMSAAILEGCIGPQSLIYVGDDAGSSAGKHVLLYNHPGSEGARRLRAVVGTIDGSQAVDWNTPLTNYAVVGTVSRRDYEPSGCKVADNKIVAAWGGDTDGLIHVRVGTVASGLITFGTLVTTGTYAGQNWGGEVTCCFDAASGKVVIVNLRWDGVGGASGKHKIVARTGTVSGTSITLGAEYDVVPYQQQYHGKVSLVYDENAQRTVLYYKWMDGSIMKLYAKAATITGTNIAFAAAKLVEEPEGSKTFEKGPNASFSYGTCSTYMAHADVKKTIVIRPGTDNANADGGYTKGTLTHLNRSTLTLDLSLGNFFELDLQRLTYNEGPIGTFTINNAAAAHVSSFVLKITQGYVARDFDWSLLTAFKWIGGTAPTLSTGNDKIDILSFTTYDNGTTWHGSVVGQNNPDATTPSNLFGERGLLGGADIAGALGMLIEYITISTLGNGTTFGNLTVSREGTAATSDASRGVWAGGDNFTTSVDTIDYITIATPSNATDFGNLTVIQEALREGATSNGSRGVFGGGQNASATVVNIIHYITIATTGNATDFGDLTSARKGSGANGDGVRGVFGGGYTSTKVNTIDYITIATTGNASDFGDLTVVSDNMGACSDGSRGLWAGGGSLTLIHSVTISTTSNAVTFGNLSEYRRYLGATSNGTRGVFLGGISAIGSASSGYGAIDYVTISTPSTASRFGDLTQYRKDGSATSGN